MAAKLTLLRSFSLVAANRAVKSNGLNAFVRQPTYAGHMLTHIGYLLASPSLWNFGVCVAVWAFLIARIVAEEDILDTDPEYREYTSRVRHRIVPGVFQTSPDAYFRPFPIAEPTSHYRCGGPRILDRWSLIG